MILYVIKTRDVTECTRVIDPCCIQVYATRLCFRGFCMGIIKTDLAVVCSSVPGPDRECGKWTVLVHTAGGINPQAWFNVLIAFRGCHFSQSSSPCKSIWVRWWWVTTYRYTSLVIVVASNIWSPLLITTDNQRTSVMAKSHRQITFDYVSQ